MVYSLGFAALCIAWLVPGHYFPLHNFQQEVVAAMGGGLLVLAALVDPKVREWPLPRFASCWLALAIVPLAQWVFGEFPFLADAVLPALYMVGFALVSTASMALTRAHGAQFLQWFALAVLAAALASVGIGLVQWLQLGRMPFLETLPTGGRVYANLTQPNHLAALLAMAVMCVAWLFETRRVGPYVAGPAVVFLLFGMVMTQSRAGWLMVLTAFAWRLVAHRRTALRCSLAAVTGAAAIFFLMTLAWARLNTAIDMPTATVLVDRVQAAGARSLHWPALWDAAWRHPLRGWGWMQVTAAQKAVALDHPASHEWITYSHDVLLDLLVWNGVLIGGIAIGLGVLWIAKRALECKDGSNWALLGCGGMIAAYALVEYPYAFLFFLLPLAVIVGAVEATHSPAQSGLNRSVPKALAWLPMLGATGLVVCVCLDYLNVEEASRRASLYEVHYVVPGQEPTPPEVMLLDNQREFIWMRLTEARPGMSAADVERMRRVNERYIPPAILLRYALAAGLNGRPADAAYNLRLVCQIWIERNCREGRESWAALGDRYPVLRSVAYPAASRGALPTYADHP